MRSIRLIISFCILALLAESCREDFDFEAHYQHKLDKLEDRFAKAFETAYGKSTSKEMTWATVVEDSITIDTDYLDPIPYSIRFYTPAPEATPEKRYLLAEYSEIMGRSGKHTLAVDYPSGMSNILVSAVNSDGIGYTFSVKLKAEEPHEVVFAKFLASKITDYPAMRYTLAFEGFTSNGLDFDYNDVVLELEYVRGLTKEMRVILKAAGNDCHTRVSYRRPTKDPKVWVDEDIFEETHAAIGYPAIYNFATDKNIYYVLNTGINDSGRSTDIFVDLEEDEGKSIVTIAQRFYAYFRLDDTKKELGDCYHLPDYTGARHPEALLIAEPDWTWAPEGQAIHVRYYRFKDWITDPKSQPQWYF